MAYFCPECGDRLQENATFCGNCGKQLNVNSGDQSGVVLQRKVVFCPYCHEEINEKAVKCKHCGEWLDNRLNHMTPAISNPNQQPQIFVNNNSSRSNGPGTIGFIFAMLAILTSFIPGLNFLTSFFGFFGLILSFIGMFFNPKGLAIAGLIISILDLIIVALIAGAITSFITSLFS